MNMTDFARTITDENKAYLAANREELLGTAQGREIWQNRVKRASECHVELKALHTDHDCVDETFPDWQTFRDNFILDWITNRTIVTEEEAEMIFETTATEALAAIEQNEQTDTLSTTVLAPVGDVTVTAELTDVVAPKAKRGRPAGKKSAKTVVAKKKTVAKKKAAAAKKTGGSASAKAQVIIEKYASRDWSRKDIILKLQSQLDMGAAYASTLYQKFA